MRTGDRGPRVDPGSREYQWICGVVRAVERLTGVPTRWNGEIYEENDPDALGAAHPDGVMTLSVADVLEPIGLVCSGYRLTADDVAAARDALATVVHEAAHLSTRDGDPQLPGAHPPADAPGEGLDEGLVEGWTLRKLDLVAYEIGMDRDVPGVIGVKTKIAYPASAAATQSLVDGVAQLTGVDSAQLADHLMLTELSQRWNVIADKVIDRHLDQLMPEGDRPVIRADLANRLRGSFARARGVDDREELNVEAKSQQGFHVGQGAVCELDAEVCRLQDGYRNRQRLMNRSVRTDRAGGTGGPRAASRMRSGTVDLDIEHLRRMMGGVAPAALGPCVDQGHTNRVAYRRPAVGRAAGRVR